MPETIDCTPEAIARASACFCFPEKEANGAIIYLLQQIAGDTSTPEELAEKSKCLCFPTKTAMAIQAMLLCNLVNATP